MPSESLSLDPPEPLTKLKAKLLRLPQPQYQIAALAQIHPTTFSGYVNGKPMLAKHLVALCDLFQCEPEEIMGYEGEPDL
jgi:hypothetical protein